MSERFENEFVLARPSTVQALRYDMQFLLGEGNNAGSFPYDKNTLFILMINSDQATQSDNYVQWGSITIESNGREKYYSIYASEDGLRQAVIDKGEDGISRMLGEENVKTLLRMLRDL